MQIKASNSTSTYIWKPISKADPPKFVEGIYVMIVLVVSWIFSIIFLLYFIPFTKSADDGLCEQYMLDCEQCPLVWIGFVIQWLGYMGLEIYHLNETYDRGVYGNMRLVFMVVAPPLIDILCIICVSVYAYKCRKPPEYLKIAYYAVLITFVWSLLRQLILLLFIAMVYFVEPISAVGIVAFGIIFAFMWSYLSKRVYKEVLAISNVYVKCLLLVTFFLIDIFGYFSINAITFFTIMVYITFLNSLPKSSADGLALKLICAFLPALLAAGFTFCLSRWFPKKEAKKGSDNAPGQRKRKAQRKRKGAGYGSMDISRMEDLSNTI